VELGITAFLTDRSMDPASLAVAVEDRGFHFMFLPEHSHIPLREPHPPSVVEGTALEDYRRGIDPLIGLAMAAQATRRILLGTGILLVAQHDPIDLAKRVATLDHLSGGRVVLGVGFGWNRAEAEDHGVAFAQRRSVAREHVACLRALWSEEEAEFHGEHVQLDPCWSWPKPVQSPLPILVGGGASDRVFSAVVDYGQGWLPIGGAGIADALPRLRARWEMAGRATDSLRIVPFGTLPTRGKLQYYESIGVSEVVLRVRSGNRDDMLHELDDHAQFLPG